MEKKGYVKTKHFGVYYWIKTCIDENGERFVSMVRCKVQS